MSTPRGKVFTPASSGSSAAAASSASARLDPIGHDADVVHRVVVREQAEVDAPVVGHDRHEDGLVGRQEPDREAVLELAAEEVDRHLRPGDVRDHHVEEAGGEIDPRRLREQRGRSEVVEARDHLGAERLLRLLEVPHLLPDRLQPRDRVLHVHGQRGAHCGELVAQVAALVLRPDGHRHLRPDLEPLGADAARVEPFAHAARDDGKHDVVDGPAQASLIRLNCARSLRTHSNRRCEPISRFSGSSGRGPRTSTRPRRVPPPPPLTCSQRVARVLDRVLEPAHQPQREPRQALDALRRQLGRGGLRGGDPLVLGAGGLGHRLQVEQHGRDVDAGDAVDQCVVRLRHEREALAGQPLDQPQLPERLRAVELLGEDPRGDVPQLLLGAGEGSAEWRTWYSRLKVGSSIQNGRPVSIGGCASFWRKRGTRCRRESTCSSRSSYAGGGPSKIRIPPTCMWADDDSLVRNETSSARQPVHVPLRHGSNLSSPE